MKKRVLFITVLALIGLTLSAAATLAQTSEAIAPTATPVPAATPTPTSASEAPQTIFPWAFKAGGFSQNWSEGIIYFLLGIVGALSTVYLFLGEFLPAMGGKTEYELLKHELEDFKKRRERVLESREGFAFDSSKSETASSEQLTVQDALAGSYEKAIERLEKRLSQERWRLFGLAFPMYILLGGFFAAAFATNFLQAILIGFGWTAVAEQIGLRREQAAKKEIRDKQISELEKRGVEATRKLEDAAREKEALQKQVDALKAMVSRAVTTESPSTSPSDSSTPGGGE